MGAPPRGAPDLSCQNHVLFRPGMDGKTVGAGHPGILEPRSRERSFFDGEASDREFRRRRASNQYAFDHWEFPVQCCGGGGHKLINRVDKRFALCRYRKATFLV